MHKADIDRKKFIIILFGKGIGFHKNTKLRNKFRIKIG